jgi:sulfite oxidase
MLVHDEEPFNAEPPRGALAESDLTATDRFYVRNHGPVPAWGGCLRLDGLVDTPREFSLDELRALPRAQVIATLQCAGNRRAGMMALREIPGEAPWGPGATGTAAWTGASLAELLGLAGVRDGAAHVAFVGADVSSETSPPEPFAGSIPLAKALSPEVLLAFEMNGSPLPAVHGGPVRVVVPGYIGARSVKWVRRVEVRAEPCDGYFQDVAYRLLAEDEEPGPGRGFPLGEVALNADVLSPDDGAAVAARELEVVGYAYAGGGRSVVRVDVAVDGAWTRASLLDDLGCWAWRRWRARVGLSPGSHEIAVRAWDSAGVVQCAEPVWNPGGYINNSWGRVRVEALR